MQTLRKPTSTRAATRPGATAVAPVVLLAVDDPEPAAHHGIAAAGLAIDRHTTVRVVTIVDGPLVWSLDDPWFRQRSDQDLAVVRARTAIDHHRVGCVTTTEEVPLSPFAPWRRRQIARAIARCAEDAGAGLILLGVRRTGAGGAGVAERLRRLTAAQVVELPC